MKTKTFLSDLTPPRHTGLFAKFFALFFCLAMGMNVWGADLPYFSAIAANSSTKTPLTNVSAATAAGGVASVTVTKSTQDAAYVTFTLNADVKTVFNSGEGSIFLCFKTDKAIQMSLCRSSNANLKVVASYDGSSVTTIDEPVVMSSSANYFSFEANKTYYISTTSTSGNSFANVRAYFKTMEENTNVTVYGWWEEDLPSACANPVTVHFAAGDGTGTMDDDDACKDSEYEIPECTFTAPTGKEFDEWISSDVTITDGKFTPETTADVTLTATWKDAAPAPSNEEFKADASGVTACSYTGTLFNFSHANAPATTAISSATANDESGKTFAKGFLPSGSTGSTNVYTFTAKADLEKIVVYYITTDSKFTTQNQSKGGNLMYQIDDNEVVTSATTGNKSNTVAYAEVIEPAEGIANESVVKIYSSSNRLAIFSVVAYAAEDVTKYHVTYAKGEGSVTGTVPTQADLAEGKTFEVAAKGDLARDGYDFTGWNDGTADYAAGATYTMGTADVVLTAQWTAHVASSDATLSDLKVNDATVEGFAAATENYNVVLPFGTIAVPTVTATAADANAKSVVVTPAGALPGATTVVVTAEDNSTKTYTINFTVATSIDVEMVWNKSNKRCDGTTPAANVNSSAFAQYLSFAFAGGGAEGSSLNTSNNAGGSFTLSAKDGFAFKSMSFFGKLQADVEFSIDGGAFTTLVTTNTNADACYSDVFADAEVHELVLRNTAANGAWIRNMQLEVIASTTPFVKHNITYLETKGATNQNPATFIEGVGIASFADLADVDGWHFTGWDVTSIGTDVTTDVTVTASWESTLSTDVTLSSLKYGEETIVTVADKFVYNVTLPYGAAVPTVTAEANHANASIGNWTQATIETKQASFTVTAEAGNTQDYQVRFTWAPKMGAEIIKATITGTTTATVDGLIGGTAEVSLSGLKDGGYKVDKGKYIGITLADDETFNEGDVVVINSSVKGTGGKVVLFADKNKTVKVYEGTDAGQEIVYVTLPAEAEDLTSLYIVRDADDATYKWNPVLVSFAVLRQMPSMIKSFTIGEAEGVIDQEAKTIAVSVPYGTDVTVLTPVVEAYANGGATVTPTTAQDFSSAKTYTVTSAYSEDDAVSYVVTVTVAEPACPTEVTISGEKTYTDGATIELTATTDGTGTITYQWYKDEVAVDGATTATFSKTATMTDGGNYVCKVNQGTCEEVASEAYAVTINKVAVKKVELAAAEVEVKVGETTTVTATITPANATYPEITEWQMPENNGIPYFSVNGGNPTTLTALVPTSGKSIYATADGQKSSGYSIKAYYEVLFSGCDAIEPMKFYGSGIKLPTPTGGTEPFIGWYSDAEFTQFVGAAGKTGYKPADNVTLYAKWTLPDAETPVITTQPQGATYDEGDPIAPLTVVATVTEGTLSYQWYKGSEEVGENSASYTPTEEGSYKVVVTNTLAGHNPASETSDVAVVTINRTYVQTDVTGSVTWDWSKSSVATLQDIYTDQLLAELIPETATFATSNLVISTNGRAYAVRDTKYAQVSKIKFHTTVPGFITVKFSDTGSSSRSDSEEFYRYLYVNGVKTQYYSFGTSASAHGLFTTGNIFVSEGDVELSFKKQDAATNCNVYIITFTETAYDATIRSGLTNGKLVTMCQANSIEAMDGAVPFEVAEATAIGIDLVEATFPLVAGKPYILEANKADVRVVYGSGEVATEAVAANGLIGNLSSATEDIVIPTWTVEEQYYIFQNNHICKTSTGNYITHDRAYLRKDLVNAVAPAPGRRRISMTTDDVNTPTGLDALMQKADIQKVMIDGHVFIIREGKMFNAVGQMVK